MKSMPLIFIVALSLSPLSHASDGLSQQSLDDIIANMLLKNTIGLRYGSPSDSQIVPINTKELYYQYRLHPISGSLIKPAFEVSVSQLNVGEEKGYVYGFGPSMSIPIGGTNGNLYFTTHGKVHYLTRSDYGRKRYGGPVHWTYGFGVRTSLSINTFATYMWQHMSNGDVYEFNPALETHTITLGIDF